MELLFLTRRIDFRSTRTVKLRSTFRGPLLRPDVNGLEDSNRGDFVGVSGADLSRKGSCSIFEIVNPPVENDRRNPRVSRDPRRKIVLRYLSKRTGWFVSCFRNHAFILIRRSLDKPVGTQGGEIRSVDQKTGKSIDDFTENRFSNFGERDYRYLFSLRSLFFLFCFKTMFFLKFLCEIFIESEV